MTAGLADRFTSRFTIVVGKGGVGKTTTSGMLALAAADAGRRTHLLSIDPAHSVGDLFGQDLDGPAPRPCECERQLVLEEFDAAASAARWLDAVRGPVAEVLERGTYLDAHDVSSFVELALPGMDEVMAALRLVELADEDAERIVVDTAPTGHALRVLHAGGVVASWTAALHAMAEKASVVASRLARRPVRFAAEDVVADLEARIERFERGVLGAAEFAVVGSSGAVVRAETDALRADLARAGRRIAAVVCTGEPCTAASREQWIVPRRPDVEGCDALRELLRDSRRSDPDSAARTGAAPNVRPVDAPRAAAAPPSGAALEWVRGLDRELLLFAGKGGVGKSTCAASVAYALAEDRRVALVGVDPAGSLSALVGRRVGEDGTELGPRLRAYEIDAERALERLRTRYRAEVERAFERVGLDRAATLDRRVIDTLWGLAPPGIDELVAMTRIIELADDADTLVVDAAPTGHFLRLLALPSIALDWTQALLRVLLEYRAVGAMTEAGGALLAFARRLKALRAQLTDAARSAAIVVTLDEPMVRAETRRLLQRLDEAGVPVGAMIENRVTDGPNDDDRAYEVAPAARVGIRAPDRVPPPVGGSMLRSFIEDWMVSP